VAPRHYVIVRTREAAASDRAFGFAVQGFATDAYVLEQGDRLALYVGKPLSGFIATMEVIGTRFFSEERIWTVSHNPSKVFPYRYPTRPRSVAPEDAVVRFTDVIDELDFSANLKNRKLWGMLFIRGMRTLSTRDFELIEERVSALSRSSPTETH
jgi:hypothetical protein